MKSSAPSVRCFHLYLCKRYTSAGASTSVAFSSCATCLNNWTATEPWEGYTRYVYSQRCGPLLQRGRSRGEAVGQVLTRVGCAWTERRLSRRQCGAALGPPLRDQRGGAAPPRTSPGSGFGAAAATRTVIGTRQHGARLTRERRGAEGFGTGALTSTVQSPGVWGRGPQEGRSPELGVTSLGSGLV